MNFADKKRKALEELQKKGTDEDIKEIIERINSYEDFFTTSSCSGRISLIFLPEVGAKKEAKFIGKWHHAVNKDEIIEVVKKAIASSAKSELWLISQSPIIHVAVKNLECAKDLLKIANIAGFKYSNIKSISNSKIMVEIISTERMDVPLGKDRMLFCSEDYIEFILERANFLLSRGKGKLNRFYLGLSSL